MRFRSHERDPDRICTLSSVIVDSCRLSSVTRTASCSLVPQSRNEWASTIAPGSSYQLRKRVGTLSNRVPGRYASLVSSYAPVSPRLFAPAYPLLQGQLTVQYATLAPAAILTGHRTSTPMPGLALWYELERNGSSPRSVVATLIDQRSPPTLSLSPKPISETKNLRYHDSDDNPFGQIV